MNYADLVIGDLYARKSTVDQGKSAARQKRHWELDCTREGHQTGRMFVDPDLSASRYSRKDRPDYAALVEHITAGGSEMVCLWEASRGTRQLAEWVAFLDLCRSKGTLIRIFGKDPHTYDPRIQRDRNELVRMGMDAETETEHLSGRVKDGLDDIARAGKPTGRLLFGYARRYDERGNYVEQVILPEQAELIRRMAADTLAGIPLGTQASRLNDAGIPTPAGKKWSGVNIRRMLLNPSYVGTRMHNGEALVTDAWPPILDRSTAARLKLLLSEPGRRLAQDLSLKHMLSGEPRCDECDSRMRSSSYQRYGCVQRGCQKASVQIDTLDRFVSSMVRARIKALRSGGLVAPPTPESGLAEAEADLRSLRERLASFYKAAAGGDLSADGLVHVENQLRPQIAAAKGRVRQLSAPSPLTEYDDIDLVGEWARLPVGVRRSVVHALARLRVVPVGRGGRWTPWRLHKSMWVGESETWGEQWEREGLERP